MEVNRSDNVNAIDAGVKNRFRWQWLESKDDAGQFLSDYIRKLDVAGVAKCIICDDKIKYASSGKKALVCHGNSQMHQKRKKERDSNQTLPSLFRNITAMESGETEIPSTSSCTLPYGAPPNVHNIDQCSGKTSQDLQRERNVSFQDRKANAEAMVTSFTVENTLTFSVVPKIIDLAKALAKDKKVLDDLHMERTTCAYKLNEGLASVTRKRIVQDMQNTPFSINLDECTSNANEKVLSILVSYFSETLNMSVVQHYASVTLTVVNAETVFQTVVDLLKNDDIPLDNVVSSLSDSAAYMRGKKSGFETRLRDVAPHLLDIDGDICHHTHNSVKKFCSFFDQHVEHLADDLYNDLKWSPDIKEHFEKICGVLGVKCNLPVERVPHRWLSSYDAAARIKSMMDPFRCLYYCFIDSELTASYTSELEAILTRHNVSDDGRQKLQQIHDRFHKKNLTVQGLARKKRIVHKLFHLYQLTILYIELYVAVLPSFKSFVLIFEQKEPLVHKLHDEVTDLFRTFLARFIKLENLVDMNAHQLANLKINENITCKLSQLVIGTRTEEIVKDMKPDAVKTFLQLVRDAYTEVGKYMQQKLPLTNRALRILSSIDPKARGHSVTNEYMTKLPKLLNVDIQADDMDEYKLQCTQYQLDSKLPPFNDGARVDKWWGEVFQHYPALKRTISAALSIFTGPRIEQSFSMMNNIITKKTNRLDVTTFASIQTVRYDLMNKGVTSVELYRRDNILKSPVDKSVCYHMLTAKSRLNAKRKRQSSNKPPVIRKRHKSSEVSSQPKSRATAHVHKAAALAKKQIFQRQKLMKVKKANVEAKSAPKPPSSSVTSYRIPKRTRELTPKPSSSLSSARKSL